MPQRSVRVGVEGATGVQAKLQVTGEDGTEQIASLWEWLSDEPVLRSAVRREKRLIGATDLSGGGVIDLLTVTLGSGGVAAVLAGCLTTWLQSRRAKVTLTVSVNGRVSVLNAENVTPRQMDATIAVLREVLVDQREE